MRKSISSFALLALAALLISCTEQVDSSAQADEVTSPVPPPSPTSPREILEAFRNDLTTCQGVVRYRSEPPAKNQVNIQEPESILDMAPYAGTPEVAYINANRDYVYIAISFHGDPFTVSRFKELVPVYCAVTTQRLADLDGFDATDEGWEVREYFLKLGINHLEPAMDIGPGGDSITWDWLQSQLEQAEKQYAKTHRAKLLAISQYAVNQIEASRAEGHKTLEQMNGVARETNTTLIPKSEVDDEIDARIDFIKRLINRLQ